MKKIGRGARSLLLIIMALVLTLSLAACGNGELDKIEITPPGTVEYEAGDVLSLAGGKVKVIYTSGKTKTVDMAATMVNVADIDMVALGEKTVTVTYQEGGKKATANFTIKIIESTAVKNVKDKIDNLPEAGAIQYSDKAAVDAARQAYDALNSDRKGLVDNYEKLQAAEQKITELGKVVQSRTLTPPTTLTYDFGEDLNLEGGEIVETLVNGEPNTVALTSAMISGYNKLEIGEHDVSVTYMETLIGSFKVTVSSPASVKAAIALIEDLPAVSELSYANKEAVDEARAAYDALNEEYRPLVTNYETLTAAEAKITELGEEVQSRELINPNETEYAYGEVLDLTGGQIKENLYNGGSNYIDLTVLMISGYDSHQVGEQTLTVTYETETIGTFTVTVSLPETVSLLITKISALPAEGELEYSDKAAVEAARADYNALSEDYQALVSNYAVLTAAEERITQLGEVVESRSLTKPTKLVYVIDETIDVTGGFVVETKYDGTDNNVPLTEDMVTGFDSSTEGTKTLTVTHAGATVDTFDITVNQAI